MHDDGTMVELSEKWYGTDLTVAPPVTEWSYRGGLVTAQLRERRRTRRASAAAAASTTSVAGARP